MKSFFQRAWPYLVVAVVLAIFSFIYFLPENTEALSLPASDVQHSVSLQQEAKKYQSELGREILWTNSLFSGMPTYMISGVTGDTWNGLARFAYSALKMGKPTTSPTGLLFSWCIGFFIMMLCFRFNWKYALLGALVFGMSTSLMHLVDNGHVNKVFVLGLLPPTLGGIWLIYRGKYLLGAALTALFVNLQIMANHLQISYYFMFLVAFLGIFLLVEAIKNKTIKNFIIATCVLFGAVLIGVLPNLPRLLTTQEYAEESIRGKTELDSPDRPKDGLTKDYAFSWAMSIPESMTHIIPNYLGGASNHFFAQDPESKTNQYLQTLNPNEANQLAQGSSAYFGTQPFTAGAWYWGITVIFLFFISFFSTRHWIRWWGLVSILFILMISWGSNFPALNYFLFDHFPLFNKFRAVSMSVNLAHMVLLLVGMFGLRDFINLSQTEKLKALKWSSLIMGAFILLGFGQAFLGAHAGQMDKQLSQFPDYLRAIREDRGSAVLKDTFRSLIFVLLLAGVFYLAAKDRIKTNLLLILTTFILLLDLIGIDKRYLPNSKFSSDYSADAEATPRTVDQQILQDKTLSYRVMDFSEPGQRNPFSDAFPSNFHKNVGGYHAAKLGIYQDIIEKYLSNPSKYMHVYSMLNTKYLITGQGDKLAVNPNPAAQGNAWFAKTIRSVENANQELEALADSSIAENVVVNKKFASQIPANFSYDSTATVRLTKYIPDDMTYEYKAATPQFLVFSEVYYPESKGWHVYIDGQRKEGLVKTDYVLRGIQVPAGQHTLNMKFEPTSYYGSQLWGKLGNVALLVLIIGAIWFALKPYLRPQTT